MERINAEQCRKFGIVNAEDFRFDMLGELHQQKRKRGNPGGKQKGNYYDLITAFDIETTAFHPEEESCLYIWQWQFGNLFTVIGRTWDDFAAVVTEILEHKAGAMRIVVFVHHLSYEFQFLSGIYPFREDEVFAVDARKVLKCTMFDTFDFRCSYMHSNMSLEEFLAKNKAEHQKLSGEDFNYDKERYPWTDLSDEEIEYCVNDVRGLVESVQNEMAADGDNLYSYPLTSTGYVRRDAKKAMRQCHHNFIPYQVPNWHVYTMLREAFRGGNTHANRFYAGRIIEDVKSADRSSSYPDVLVNCEFPVKRFYECPEHMNMDQITDLITRRHKAVLMRVALWNPRPAEDSWGCPYLSFSKCRGVVNPVLDNGRIIMADYLETTITDVDFRIIIEEYDFDNFMAFDVAHATYGKLPKSFTDTIIHYYVNKTTLKNVPGMENLYNKSKAKLNSLYGMTAQDPAKITMQYIEGKWQWKDDDQKVLLEAANEKAFLVYQWGVWTTAWARLRLEEGIRMAGDRFVYCDTDSVKYVGDIDWTGYNAERIRDSTASGAHAKDPDGIEHYMGVYEADGHYDRFATLGAKKYVVEEDGKLEVTIAGVNKKKGAAELQKHGGIEAFRTGFIFTEGGGTASVYNDTPEHEEIIREGRSIPVTRNVMIKDSTYTLGITAEYEFLLRDPNLIGRCGLTI